MFDWPCDARQALDALRECEEACGNLVKWRQSLLAELAAEEALARRLDAALVKVTRWQQGDPLADGIAAIAEAHDTHAVYRERHAEGLG